MSKDNRDGVVVKKVRAFPIKGQIKGADGVALPISILKLAEVGFLAELQPTAMQPGDRFEVSFEIPVEHWTVNSSIKVVKLYHHWGDLSGSTEQVGAAAKSASVKSDVKGAPGIAPHSSAEMPAGALTRHLVEFHFVTLASNLQIKIRSFLHAISKHAD